MEPEDDRMAGEPISKKEAARILGVSTVTIRNWCRAGILAHRKLPNGRLQPLKAAVLQHAQVYGGSGAN
jgi:predicted site-specific integrase-resolvase